ncbi:MAG: ABC transporter permease [Gammaproteobacteria bacterium]|nr:ABC transporter permease [Gammaproteobacteria bacterium]MYF66863.1 ABC transporter permease [Gammaproteobacteria bacterium]MYK36295.1 ABC transporter permease [Gammaproteobacteria bacterium]
MREFIARLNPELLRGWRAEATRLRLAITLLLSAGVAWCIQLAWDWSALGRAGAIAFGIFSFVVTPIRIVGAIAEEHNRHTWQRQRMSALSPAQLMLGKAFGATALTDLAALCALVCWGLGVYLPGENPVVLGGAPPEAAEAIAERMRAGFPVNAWLMVCANLFARLLALALAIRNCDRSRAARGRSFVVAILLALLLTSPLTALKEGLAGRLSGEAGDAALWFGFVPMSGDAFWAASGFAFVAFAAFWCWCAARETLSGRRFAVEAPVIGLGLGLWWAGTAYAAADAARFVSIEGGYGPGRYATAALLLILTAIAYLWGVAERVDRRRAREFLAAPSLRAMPAWLLILLLADVTVAVHLVAGAFATGGELGYIQQNFWAISLLGFLVRDMGILFLVLAGRVRRWPELAALASWLVLGLFIPGALSGAEAAVGTFELYLLFSPIALQEATGHLVIGAVSAWVQAGLVVSWLIWRGRAQGGNEYVESNA